MLQMPIVILFPMAFTGQNNIEVKVMIVVWLWVLYCYPAYSGKNDMHAGKMMAHKNNMAG